MAWRNGEQGSLKCACQSDPAIEFSEALIRRKILEASFVAASVIIHAVAANQNSDIAAQVCAFLRMTLRILVLRIRSALARQGMEIEP